MRRSHPHHARKQIGEVSPLTDLPQAKVEEEVLSHCDPTVCSLRAEGNGTYELARYISDTFVFVMT